MCPMAVGLEYTMVSDAKKRADAKYRKEKVRQVVVRFGPPDADLLEHLEGKENMAGYIKQLIRADMERARPDDGRRA